MELHQEDSASSGSSFKLSDDSGIEDSWQEFGDNGALKKSSDDLKNIMLDTDLSRAFQGVGLPTIATQDSLLHKSSESQKDQLANSPTQFGPFPLALPYLDTYRHADVEDESASPYICGLTNIGNTCFINAAIQCLLVTPFTEIISKENSQRQLSNHQNQSQLLVQKKIKEILDKLATGKYSCVSTKEFHETLSKCGCPFTDFKQHDCQEFILYLLNVIHDVTKENNYEQTNTCDDEKDGSYKEESKRLRLDRELSETDAGVECEDATSDIAWKKHMLSNNSPITCNFLGQYKSTVTCEKCGHSSFSYESFMCLSLPIPFALEQQIEVFWFPFKTTHNIQPTRFLLTVKKSAIVRDLFKSLNEKLTTIMDENSVIFAEVEGQRLFRILNPSMKMKYLDKKKHKIVAYEVNSMSKSPSKEETAGLDTQLESSIPSHDAESCQDGSTQHMITGEQTNISWHTCAICLEEMFDDELAMHSSCGGAICEQCLQTIASYHNNASFPCPVCNSTVSSSDFTKHENSDGMITRIVTIPRLMRKASENFNKMQLIGMPRLFQAPSVCSYNDLKALVEETLSCDVLSMNWCLKITNSSGLSCSRCDFPATCSGCIIDKDTEMKLKAGDAVMVELQQSEDNHYKMIENEIEFVDDFSLHLRRENDVVYLEECLDAFTKTEWLGTDNPWYCNTCQQNRTAAKSITISRLPNTLIIHLKRFYFDEGVSKKITNPVVFPNENLILPSATSLLSNSEAHENCSFDLLGMVNHVGSLTGGHYTASTRHPITKTWTSFSDDVIDKSMTSEDQHEKVYLFIYGRKL